MACERHETGLREAALGRALPGEVEAHLEQCPACRAALAEERALLRTIDQGLRSGLLVEPSPGFGARVRRAGKGDRAASFLPLAASLAVLAAGVLLLIRGIGRDLPVREPRPLTAPSPAGRAPSAPAESAPPPRRPAPVRAVGSRSGGGDPEVLLPPGESVALVPFPDSLLGRALLAASLLTKGEEGQESLEPRELVIPPLEVKPLPAPELRREDAEKPRDGRRP
jgi:hypothetical protein